MDVLDAIRLRRSVKPERMKPDPLDRATIEQLLECANWAPSHGLTEPWRFVVFTGDSRRQVSEAFCRSMADDGQDTLPADDPRRAKLEKKVDTAPVAIAIVCAPSTKPKIEAHEELCSTAMAVQNLHLAARAMGLAGFWSSGKKSFHPAFAQMLGIEPPARCLGVFYLGYPAEPFPDGARRPVEEKVEWR